MGLGVIGPCLTGDVPKTLREQVAGYPGVDVVFAAGVRSVGKVRRIAKWLSWHGMREAVEAALKARGALRG